MVHSGKQTDDYLILEPLLKYGVSMFDQTKLRRPECYKLVS